MQYESELQTAIVNLRTAKIQLLQLLNDRTPVDQFDVTGPFDFSDALQPLDRFPPERPGRAARPAGGARDHPAVADQPQAGRRERLDRSDLRRVVHVELSRTTTRIGLQTLGASVNIPLRIFDRNQGEKKRTQIDIDRSQQASEATRAQVFSDVDTAYAEVRSNIELLKPYKAKYNDEALQRARHRDLLLRARRRFADGFSERAERLPPGATGLRTTDRRLSDSRRTTESCRRTRGDPMTKTSVLKTACCLAAWLALAGCEKKFNPASGAASPAQVVETGNAGLVTVDHPEQYPTVAAGRIDEPDKLDVTGSVFPDISREIPVISMANGRVVDIRARLDDNVKKGQLLFSVQSPDISNAFDTYVKAVDDEQLANKAYMRAKDLYQHGAISQAMLEQAEDTEKDAKADLTAAEEQLKIFGVDKEHPSPIVKVYAPISGVIVAQNITEAAAAGVALSGTATAFTVADLSRCGFSAMCTRTTCPRCTLGQQAQIKLDRISRQGAHRPRQRYRAGARSHHPHRQGAH